MVKTMERFKMSYQSPRRILAWTRNKFDSWLFYWSIDISRNGKSDWNCTFCWYCCYCCGRCYWAAVAGVSFFFLFVGYKRLAKTKWPNRHSKTQHWKWKTVDDWESCIFYVGVLTFFSKYRSMSRMVTTCDGNNKRNICNRINNACSRSHSLNQWPELCSLSAYVHHFSTRVYTEIHTHTHTF